MSTASDVLTRAIRNSRVSLRKSGHISCFLDEDWIRHNTSSDEWAEYLEYQYWLAEEVVATSSPENILFSDLDEYRWETEFFSSRVASRRQLRGTVEDLFSSPLTRHFVELTSATQKLALFLEGTTEQDAAQVAERSRKFGERRDIELSRMSADPRFEELAGTYDRLVKLGLDAPVRSYRFCESAISTQLVIDHVDDATFCYAVVSIAEREEARRVMVNRALPGAFQVYSDCDSQIEGVLCISAWNIVLGEIDTCSRAANCTLSGTQG